MPIESVALKLFTGIEKFEIMAIPFFILAGNFLTHGGVAQADDQLRDLAGRPLARRARARRRAGLRALRRGVRVVAGDGRRHRLDPAAGDGPRGFSQALRRRRHHDLGRARHPDPAVDRDGDVLGLDQTSVGALFMAGIIPGIVLATMLGADDVVPRAAATTIRAADGELGRALKAFRERSGA